MRMTPPRAANLGQELVDRYFLGRSGALLPYNEFVKERPDVSREEYNQYKNYLFGDKSVVKATMDGVQGPEVTFMGKSLPLMTGILPGVAGVLGARRGVKRGLEKLGKSGAMDQELKERLYAQSVREKAAEANKNNQSIDAKDYKSPAKAETCLSGTSCEKRPGTLQTDHQRRLSRHYWSSAIWCSFRIDSTSK